MLSLRTERRYADSANEVYAACCLLCLDDTERGTFATWAKRSAAPGDLLVAIDEIDAKLPAKPRNETGVAAAVPSAYAVSYTHLTLPTN